jgi:hypothetical protein
MYKGGDPCQEEDVKRAAFRSAKEQEDSIEIGDDVTIINPDSRFFGMSGFQVVQIDPRNALIRDQDTGELCSVELSQIVSTSSAEVHCALEIIRRGLVSSGKVRVFLVLPLDTRN